MGVRRERARVEAQGYSGEQTYHKHDISPIWMWDNVIDLPMG